MLRLACIGKIRVEGMLRGPPQRKGRSWINHIILIPHKLNDETT